MTTVLDRSARPSLNGSLRRPCAHKRWGLRLAFALLWVIAVLFTAAMVGMTVLAALWALAALKTPLIA